MGEAVTIGLDLAKSVFQVHGVDAAGLVVIRRQFKRAKVLEFFAKLPRCLVGMEACAAAHYWGRELRKLGHDARLMPPSYVKAYVKRQKNDAADAEAICEAVTRPSMRYVEIKTVEQQSVLALHRVRQTLMHQRIQLSNAIRGHMAEHGLVAPVGRNGLARLIDIINKQDDDRLPEPVRSTLSFLVEQLELVNAHVLENDRHVNRHQRWTPPSPTASRGYDADRRSNRAPDNTCPARSIWHRRHGSVRQPMQYTLFKSLVFVPSDWGQPVSPGRTSRRVTHVSVGPPRLSAAPNRSVARTIQFEVANLRPVRQWRDMGLFGSDHIPELPG